MTNNILSKLKQRLDALERTWPNPYEFPPIMRIEWHRQGWPDEWFGIDGVRVTKEELERLKREYYAKLAKAEAHMPKGAVSSRISLFVINFDDPPKDGDLPPSSSVISSAASTEDNTIDGDEPPGLRKL
jgi:hypothetical protein